MLRTLGGYSVYFTCSCAWSSFSSIVTWSDALTGVRALLGCALRKKRFKVGTFQGEDAEGPAVMAAAVTVLGQRQFAVFKWTRPQVKVQKCCLSHLNGLCWTAFPAVWKGFAAGVSWSPCHPARHNHQRLGSTGVIGEHCRAATAPGTAPGAKLSCKQVPLVGDNQLLIEPSCCYGTRGKILSFMCNKEGKITIPIPFFSQC